jgi:hypothetical protein
MSYYGYVTTLKNVREHPNADRMKLAECFGNTACVGLDAADGDIVLYFPVDGQLSEEYCAQNDLVRRKDENGKPAGGYLDPVKRNVRAIKLRGEKSDGLVMPLFSLAYTGVDISTLHVGDSFTAVNGHEICQKYIPRVQIKTGSPSTGNRTRKKKVPIAPLFVEHADTEQLNYNLGAFLPGDDVEITLKVHGTSQRTAYVPTLKGYKRTLLDKLFGREGTPIYDYGFVSGTRRTVLEDYGGGFYGNNSFRERFSKYFEGKLHKGEEIYYEVVGFTDDGASIMADVNNSKISDKAFTKQYGKTTVFSYGCSRGGLMEVNANNPRADMYVYRMTMVNPDGDIVEYPPDFMRYRCEQMGVKSVIVLWRGRIPDAPKDADGNDISAGEWIKNIAEQYYDGPDPIGKTHVREGVVCRIVNRPKFCAYKTKNFSFKVLEGLAKDEATAPDMEEAQESEENI